MNNSQNLKVPHYRGSRLPRAHIQSHLRCAEASPVRTCGAGDGRQCKLISPEVAEPVGRKLGVPDGVLDVLVAEIVLQGSGVMPIVGELIAARMPQHVRMQ